MNDRAAMLKAIELIASQHFHTSTLETRHSDQDDFHTLPVWSIRDALIAAYRAGYDQGEKKGQGFDFITMEGYSVCGYSLTKA